MAVPTYDRSLVKCGIVHLGVGAFHRSHQAVYVDDCLGTGALDWGIMGVSLRAGDTRDALVRQDGLYTLAIRDDGQQHLRVIGSLLSVQVAPEDPGKLLTILSDPAVRIVTLTVTEKAYLRGPGGGLDQEHPLICHDLAHPTSPQTAHGFLAEALDRRRKSGTAPFSILCCDNLPANGATVRNVLLAFAARRGAELAKHIERDVAFPSSMVDRIVPATQPQDQQMVSKVLGVEDAWPVMTEPFSQWVVEDHFPSGRPSWESAGVTMVKDVLPFEVMKLRLLNGSHSALAYLGLLSGHATVDEAFAAPNLRGFIDGLWAEAVTTLPATQELSPVDYMKQLSKRYANKALMHQLRQIATDGSQKLPQRIISAALGRLTTRRSAEHLALVPAAWIAACAARNAARPVAAFTDPLDAGLDKLLTPDMPAAETVNAVFALTGFAQGSPWRAPLQQMVARHLEHLRRQGVAAALDHVQGKAR